MIDVCLIYDIDNIAHDFIGQTPGNKGIFFDCKFTLFNQNNIDQLPAETDALIVLNSPFTNICIKAYPSLTFLISQEAPNDRYEWHTNSFKHFSKVYTQWPLKKANIIPSHGFLTWYIEKEYDELLNIDLNKPKNASVVYIGNKEAILPGQIKRNNFVEQLKETFITDKDISIDLVGKSYDNPIKNKFDALNGHQYALAIENTITNHYWTEKLADSFLAGCLPFYIGPDNIYDYFPKESIIKLDYESIENSAAVIKHAIDNNEFERRINSINLARNKILKEYNLFYRFAEIINNKIKQPSLSSKTQIMLPKNYWNTKKPLWQLVLNKFKNAN